MSKARPRLAVDRLQAGAAIMRQAIEQAVKPGPARDGLLARLADMVRAAIEELAADQG